MTGQDKFMLTIMALLLIIPVIAFAVFHYLIFR